jgi:DNA-binding CsgD family transcriptional regulator
VYAARLQRLLPRVDQGNQQSGEWAAPLREVGEYLKGKAVALTFHDFSHNRGFIYRGKGFDPEYLHSYALHFSRYNAWMTDESDYRPPGKIHVGEQLVSESDLVRTKLYSEWLQPQNLHHRLCAVLSRDRETAVLLEIMRPRELGRFNETDIEACRVLVPHLQQLLRMDHRIAELETERDAALHALEYLPWGVILVDDHGNRLATNRRAQAILLAQEGLMAHGDSLRAVVGEESARLDRLLNGALKGTGGGGGSISITRPLKAQPLGVVVIPLRSDPEELADPAPAAAIFISDPDMPLGGNERRLRELYALTAVEARLASRLSQGQSVEEAAMAMGVTVNTARAYLKRIYSKLGVRRQSDLIRRLLLGLSGLSQHHQDPSS